MLRSDGDSVRRLGVKARTARCVSMEKDAALRQLEAVADALAHDGKSVLAERTRDAVAALRRDGHGHDPSAVMSPDEAAKLLGIGNVGMIGRWARDGLLEGASRKGND